MKEKVYIYTNYTNDFFLQESLDVHGDVSYTCETSGYFFLYQVR